MYKRLAIDLTLIVLAFILPWWLVLILLISLLFYFTEPPYLESLIIGFILDMLYGTAPAHFPYFILFTAISYILLITIFFLKKRLRFY